MLDRISQKITIQKFSSTIRGRKFFFVAFLFLSCRTGGPYIKDIMATKLESVNLAAEYGSINRLLLYKGNPTDIENNSITIPEQYGTIKLIYSFDEKIYAITEKKGILIIKNNESTIKHIPISKDMLSNNSIRSLAWNPIKKSLLITYKTRTGSGVTECIENPDNNDIKCKSMTKENSELKSDYVAQVVVDAKGNAWFRYEKTLELGVSRLTIDGEWDHFDNSNSQLGSSAVTLIRTEKKDEGFKGDNVWFVSTAGLSRLQYDVKKKKMKIVEEKINNDEEDELGTKITIKDYKEKEDKKVEDKKEEKAEKKPEKKEKNETWMFYGDKKASDNALLRLMGVHSWFTDAIMDIVDIEMLEDSILIATKDAVYHFEPKSILRYTPNMTGGIEKNIIITLFYRNEHFFVKIKPETESNHVSAYMIFDMNKKKWHKLDYWKIKKSNPQNIAFTPFNNKNEIVLLKYEKDTKLALFKYSDYSLQLIDIEPKK